MELRDFLRERLPNTWSSTYTVLDAFPLTPNGKVDRLQLPAPDSRSPDRASLVPPRGETEQTIAQAWRDALRRDEVGVEDNFFDLGGHSILLVQVQVGLEKAMGREVAIVEMFQYPTIRTLAAHLSRQQAAS